MIILMCFGVMLLAYYFWPPKIGSEYIELNGAIVKVITSSVKKVIISYRIGGTYSKPITVSRFYFKTNFIKWMKSS